MKPEVSVIIPTFNRSLTTRRALESVLKQTHQNFELIVVDDGSSDESDKTLAHIHGIRYIKQRHLGVSAARNRGLQEAQANLVAFLDSDDSWLPTKLEQQVAFFAEKPRSWVMQTEEIWIRNGNRVNPLKKHQKKGGWIFNDCLPLCIVSPSAIMMRRELFEKVGHFDETLPACEDYDLWLRIAAKFPIDLLSEPLVVKTGGHSDQLSRTIPTLDRYRIQSLEKLLYSNYFSREQRKQALLELKKKCQIYGNGCLKRGKKEEGKVYLALPKQF